AAVVAEEDVALAGLDLGRVADLDADPAGRKEAARPDPHDAERPLPPRRNPAHENGEGPKDDGADDEEEVPRDRGEEGQPERRAAGGRFHDGAPIVPGRDPLRGLDPQVGRSGRRYFACYAGKIEERTMQRLSVELIPDPELGGFTARIPDIPAYGEGETEQAI